MAKDKRYAWRLVAAVGALELVATACGPGEEPVEDAAPEEAPDPAEDEAPDEEPDAPAVSPGLEDCDENPNTCNEGSVAEGGSITWLVDQRHGGVFNQHRGEGGSVVQMIEGLHPSGGYFAPDGEWTWDFDFFEDEPQMIEDEPQTMQFTIRDEAVWSDGEPIDVDDYRWIWHHNSGNEEHCVGCSPRITSFWDSVASVACDDGKTITITLEDGAIEPEWFASIGDPGLYPAHWSGADVTTPEGMGESSDFFLTNTPDWSGGPYIVEVWITDERVIMVPNPDWYGETQPALDTVIKEVISDQGLWLPALNNREIDGGSPGSFFVDLVGELEALPDVHVGLGSAGGVWEHVDVNMDSIDDLALRQAIFTALDTQDARTRIFGDLEPPLRTNHIFSELSPFHEDVLSDTGFGTGDVEAARQILADAGYQGYDGGTLVDPDGNEVPDVRFAYMAGNENRATYTELAQSYLADIGVTLVPEAIPVEQLAPVLVEADYDLVIFGWESYPLFVNAPHIFWHSESGLNFGSLVNDEIDELVSAVPNQLDIEDSAALANEASALVLEEAYVLPLWDTLNLMFVSDEYANIRDNHNSSRRAMYNLDEWGVLATN